MEKQNVTLSLPKETLRKAKILAAERHTSLSALLTQTVEEIVAKSDRYEIAKQRQLILMEKGVDFGLDETITWSRGELHER
ncbi:MAG: CopG family transcriptional regulator [Ardenticatenaceae bacterium]|nr:MAG: CopG family transcriptional regulator [Ardenticatenaceae bacterium]